ncbi:MAG: sigma-54-dependent Fis family transcriptional regulator [Candidatus Eisenbacteria bacterium]|uniref:Sigma-54-dependent Fis family transcriptional regulator n=2 Tax=Eiseniibacteriota bacterium TaxID=2212470 RepID=A0A538SRI1_UNCEI|nr:MAG: sigma-54-dependent Fis family transcriptional regulator [Candidatus Eisenbacteria bacterium]
MKLSVLVVDDEVLIRKSLTKVLRARGYAVEPASTGAEGLQKVTELRPQVMILDMRLPDTDGLSVLRRVREMDPLLQVIVITAFGDVQSAVDAMKLGACDFLRKPYEMEDIVLAVQAAGQTFRQASELDLYRRQAWRQFSGEEIIGRSGPMREVRELIGKVVRSKATSVLITGESGTGKELVARAIHYRADRAKAPLMEVNCSSFHENLLENELFGHERGAFTDAGDTKKGLVELCDGGTLFLDEVADMSLPTQAKLLRFIDHRNFKRVGGAQDISVDIRIVAATNKDLEAEVRAGRFRGDLYFRLKVVSIHMPRLQDRGDDVLLLARHFLREFARKFQKRFGEISPPAAQMLRDYAWPGNVRELRNLIERVVLLEEGRRLQPEHLSAEFTGRVAVAAEAAPAAKDAIALPTLAQMEADHIGEVLRLTAGNKSRAARILGISRQGLIEKLRRLRVEEGAGRQVS